ncbi:hypothetical protein [uncultured Deinococcus sp.]|uniref:hypothetical protein n=1 Tax=uncultured Deinococcus sp. TaxID=158789 RepID=UPI0025FED6D8|nr:hypothetical protein [uncultured Deinococcus sp.]
MASALTSLSSEMLQRIMSAVGRATQTSGHLRATPLTLPLRAVTATTLAALTASTVLATSPSHPPLGRYACLRLALSGNVPAPDITLLRAGAYRAAGGAGTVTYDSSTRTLRWRGGPLDTAKTRWVAVYVPAGPGAKEPTLRVRALADVVAGNAHDLQWCTLAP